MIDELGQQGDHVRLNIDLAQIHIEPGSDLLSEGEIVGTLLGCLNAVLIHYLRITSIIITIATMSVYFGLLMYFSKGKSIYTLPDWLSTRVVFYEAELARLVEHVEKAVARLVPGRSTSTTSTARSTVTRHASAKQGDVDRWHPSIPITASKIAC